MDIFQIFQKGGSVAWVLLAYSIIALTIILERYYHFLRMGRIPHDFNDNLKRSLYSKETRTLISGKRGPEVAVISGLLRARSSGIQDLARVAIRIGARESQRMQRGFRTLSLLSDTAPLLGLLGTIIGMVKTFIAIEQLGNQASTQVLAGGIWEAMVTTGLGLTIALPVLFLLHMLESFADRRYQAMQFCASVLVESATKRPHVASKNKNVSVLEEA